MTVDEQLQRAARAHRTEFEHALIPELPTRSRKPARVAPVLVAVVAVVAVVATVTVATRRNHSSGSVRVTAPTTTPAATSRDLMIGEAPILMPTYTPPGEQVWSVASTRDAAGGAPTESQLFGTARPDGTLSPGLLVEVDRNPPGSQVVGNGEQVRGVHAAIGAPKDAPGADLEIRWVEGDASVVAITRGIPRARAVAILDALRARGLDLVAGFDPASAPADLPLVGEIKPNASGKSNVTAEFQYASTSGNGGGNLEVRTQTSTTYPGYLRGWLGGRKGADGVVVEPDAYLAYTTLMLRWSDGRGVDIRADDLDPATLERIGRSIEATSSVAADALSREVSARLVALPLLGSTTFGDITVEVHGAGDRAAACVRVAQTEPVCHTNVRVGGASVQMSGQLLVGDRWIVFGADRALAPTIVEGTPPLGAPTLPASTATIAEWHVVVLEVPRPIDQVQVNVPISAQEFVNATFSRPRS